MTAPTIHQDWSGPIVVWQDTDGTSYAQTCRTYGEAELLAATISASQSPNSAAGAASSTEVRGSHQRAPAAVLADYIQLEEDFERNPVSAKTAVIAVCLMAAIGCVLWIGFGLTQTYNQ
jgi:hypothetical protein